MPEADGLVTSVSLSHFSTRFVSRKTKRRSVISREVLKTGLRSSLLIFLASFSMIAAMSRPAKGATIVVCASGCQFATVQAGVDAASDGDTVQVLSGTYFERVIITKSVSLVGQDRSNTVIDGFGNGSVVHVQLARSVVIRGFTIRNGQYGIHLSYAVGGSITNNIVTSNLAYGIRLYNSSGVLMSSNTVSNDYRGISLSTSARNNITLNTVSSNVFGIRLYNSSANYVTGNTVFSNSQGIALSTTSSRNTIDGNTVSLNTDYGIRLYNSTDNSVLGNRLANDFRGIDIFLSGGSVLRTNALTGTGYNFGVDGDSQSDFTQDIDTTNTVNSKPVYYLANRNTVTISPATYPNIGYLGIVSSSNIVVQNLNLTNNIQGLLLAYTSRSTVTGIHFSNNYIGLLLVHSTSNSLNGNTVDSSGRFGVFIRSSPGNVLRLNTIRGNLFNFGVKGVSVNEYVEDIDTSNTVDQKPVYYWVNQQNKQIPLDAGYVAIVNSTSITIHGLLLNKNYQGALLAYSSNSTIENTKASNNTLGIALDHSSNNYIRSNTVSRNIDQGVYLTSSSRNSIALNNINYTTSIGLGVQWYSSSNTVHGNNFFKNGYGVYFSNSSGGNIIDHNNLLNNTIQAFQDVSSVNTWNDVNKQGNYWSDYLGVDFNGDGIGDTLLPHLGFDFYPLTKAFNQSQELKQLFQLDWADVDNNGVINILDVADAALVFGHSDTYWDLNLNGTVDILDVATIALYFNYRFPGTQPYPGKGYPLRQMDQSWKEICFLLPEPLKTYCNTRI